MKKGERRSGCPSAEKLFVFVNGQDVMQTRQRIRAHVARCRRCWEAVEMLQRFIQWELTLEIAEAYRDVVILQL